jgi:hypothetical protein
LMGLVQPSIEAASPRSARAVQLDQCGYFLTFA